MKFALSDNARIFLALLQRELIVLRKELKDALIDGIIVIGIDALTYGYLFPLMGMQQKMIAPIFIGSVFVIFFMLSYSKGLEVIFDLKYSRFIDYHMTLPISRSWLFAVYVARMVLHSLVIALPIIIIGAFLFGAQIPAHTINIPAFLVMSLLTLIFSSILFLALCFYYSYNWFMVNIWPRRLTPLFCIGSIFFPWKMVNAFSPSLGILFLFNPFTFMAEGLRSTLLGSTDYISPIICMFAIIGWTILALLIMIMGIRKRLDPVYAERK